MRRTLHHPSQHQLNSHLTPRSLPSLDLPLNTLLAPSNPLYSTPLDPSVSHLAQLSEASEMVVA